MALSRIDLCPADKDLFLFFPIVRQVQYPLSQHYFYNTLV